MSQTSEDAILSIFASKWHTSTPMSPERPKSGCDATKLLVLLECMTLKANVRLYTISRADRKGKCQTKQSRRQLLWFWFLWQMQIWWHNDIAVWSTYFLPQVFRHVKDNPVLFQTKFTYNTTSKSVDLLTTQHAVLHGWKKAHSATQHSKAWIYSQHNMLSCTDEEKCP